MNKKFTVASFKESKDKGRKISMLTAYDYPTAKILDGMGLIRYLSAIPWYGCIGV